MKKILCVVLAAVLCFCLTACADNQNGNGTPTVPKRDDRTPQTVGTAYPDKALGFQLELPSVGEEIAIMHTNYGDIYIRFFPEAAPKAVQNFTTHAKNGYYNGLTFHRVIADFMIQGGDPEGRGTGGESIWGGSFEDEFDSKLLNLRGSLAMANNGVNTNGSQFFINQATPNANLKEKMWYSDAQYIALKEGLEADYDAMVEDFGAEVMERVYGTKEEVLASQLPAYIVKAIPEVVWELYERTGGAPHLDGAFRQTGGHTVFGQVFKGMNVVDQIAAVNVDPNYKPKTDVIINSIEFVTYQG